MLLILLGLALAALAFVKLMPSGSASRSPAASNQPRVAPTTGIGPGEQLDPQAFEVQLEALTADRPKPSDAARNPFAFAPKPAPPPPVTKMVPPPEVTRPNGEQTPILPPAPPPPPPIPLKFMGLVEGQKKKLAALTDCKFVYSGEEGDIIDGRYRLVKIGIESVIMEHADGRGRTTIRLSGDCPGR